MEKASKKCHVRELRGKTVAIDTYCWLHKGKKNFPSNCFCDIKMIVNNKISF